MKKYRVAGTNKEILLQKVAEKLKVSPERIAHKELGIQNKKVVLEVWIKSEEELVETQSNYIEDNIELEVNKEGVFLFIKKGEIDFNEVINFIAEKDIEAPEMEKISEAYENRGEKVKIAEYYEGMYIPAEIKITVSPNKMEAYLLLTEPKGMNLPKPEEIMKKIEEAGIKYGVRKELILKSLKSKRFNQELVVAEGKAPVDGENAKIQYNIKSIEKKSFLKPMMLDNGKVDFKNLEIIENVEAEQVLAEKLPPSPGVDGINVYGDVIKAKVGKDVQLFKGKNTYINEEGTELIAKIDGMVSCKEKKIDVLKTFVVENVGISTGNIDFVGNVVVKGDIMPDYTVKATGNIEVKGNAEKAQIICEGDVVVRGSCFGKVAGKIQAHGDVILNFAEAVSIETDGNVIANEAIMNSKVFCGKKVTVIDRKGVIIGGEIKAAEGIEAINIGSHHAVKTEIEVGSNPKILEKLKQMEEDLEESSKKMEQVEKNVTLLQKMKKNLKELPPEKKLLLNQMISAKFTMTRHINELETMIDDYTLRSKEIKGAIVAIHGVCYPGIKIKIRKGTYFAKENIENVRFYYEDGDVKFTSLV